MAEQSDDSERLAILHAVTKPLDRETVGEICARCGISRKKFYRLFHSKQDIMFWYLDKTFGESLYEIGRTLDWIDGIAMCLNLFNKERDFLTLDYNYWNEKPNSYYWPLDKKRQEVMTDTMARRGIEVTPTLEVEMRLYSGEVPALIKGWIQCDGAFKVGEYAEVWARCVPDDLYTALAI